MNHRMRGADQETIDAARLLRKQSTIAEHQLWEALRDRRLNGLKFRRQQPLGPFIVDFYCAEQRLIIEIDGESHNDQHEYDESRTQYLTAPDRRVLRYTNDQVLSNLDKVLQDIAQATTLKS